MITFDLASRKDSRKPAATFPSSGIAVAGPTATCGEAGSATLLSRQVSDAARRSLPRSQSPIGCKPCGNAGASRERTRHQGMLDSHGLGAGRLHRTVNLKARMTRALSPNKGQMAMNEYGTSYTVARTARAAARFVVSIN